MEPLPRRVRTTYLVVLGGLFALIIPVAILYATGYRLTDFALTPTGGVFVVAPVPDAIVSVNGKQVGTTGLFIKSFYVDDLAPGAYVVSVAKDGYYPWAKTLNVEPSLVTDVAAFMVPEELITREIVVGTTTATTTRGVSRAERATMLAAFATTTRPTTILLPQDAEEEAPLDEKDGQGLFIENGNVVLRWLRNPDTTPSGFCMAPSSCAQEFLVESGREVATEALFYRQGALYRTAVGNIYYAETDSRPSPLSVKLYGRKGADFRIVSGDLLVKDGQSLYEISGF